MAMVQQEGGQLNDSYKETLKFNDIDPNGYYQIIIYGDYDLEDGTGIHQNAELGRASFVTRPLASLGYMQVRIDDKEITQNSMNLGIRIDENQTDARLLAILDKVEVVIYDQGKNVESASNNGNTYGQEQTQEEIEVQRIMFTDEQVAQLKTAEEVELNLQQLNSNTKYRIDVITTVKQGTVEEIVEDKQNLEQLITLKMPAEVQIKNKFVIGTMIDLDMRIEDSDNAVLTNQVRIEIRDKDNKLVDLSEMPTNAEYERKVYEDLTPNEQYRIIVYAPQYNEGSTDATYHADYILKEIKIVTETGISGRLDLIGLEKTPTGKNLVDVSSKVNWYEKCFNTNYKYGLSYSEENKILTLGGSSSHNNINYYDFTKYLRQEVTISFKAKKQSNTNISIVEKNNNDLSTTSYTTYYTISDLSNDWKEYKYTVTLNKSGYIGFFVHNNNAIVEIQDLQIELGNRKTDYEEFKYNYNANIAVTVNDARNEITTNDYYIRIYKNNEQIQELRYEEIGEDNKVENAVKTYGIEPDANYEIELLVKIGERFYGLDSQAFSTEDSRELEGIFNTNDFLKIQPYGEYIVINNLDLGDYSGNKYQFGSSNMYFNGKINFNGKTLTRGTKNSGTQIFDTVGDSGIVENLVFNIKMNKDVESALHGGLADTNRGTLRNIRINLIESKELRNNETSLFVWSNFGVIENFIINLQKPLYMEQQGAIISRSNVGTIKNGYLYGENIKITNQLSSMTSRLAGVTQDNAYNGMVENVYSLINLDNIYPNASKTKANLVLSNYNHSTVQNVYSVGVGKDSDISHGPNVYDNSSSIINNCYYFTDEIFTSGLESKGNPLALYDTEFQNQLINGDGTFNVNELVTEGFYPQLNMPECMPAQDYIELPEVVDSDLPDILSTKVLEQGTDTVKVEFSVNNPSAEQITGIQIENIEAKILSQEYKDGKSTVIVELKNPVICVSSYNLISLTTKGAFGTGYTRPYEKGERVINVDLYKEIWNVNDWKNIKNSPTENYMLMTDLNFVNEGNNLTISEVRGIINGNNHCISNINLTNAHFIANLYGTVKDLYVKNTNIAYGGIISNAQSGSDVENVHLSDANIAKSASGNAGGIVSYANSSNMTNCSVTNIKIYSEIIGTTNDVNYGGIVGNISNTTVENCFVKGLDIKDSKGVRTAIGGIVGLGNNSNTIRNCYAEGKINSVNSNVGGIAGQLTTIRVENCYSKVNIETTNINVGGILGYHSGVGTSSSITNNLSLGSIYTSAGIENINRIVGSSEIDTTANNYALENQLLNGYVRDETKGATLLKKEKILDLDLGDSYNYDGKEKGVLPKLYYTYKTELLPNQKDILIDENLEENVVLEVENIETNKPNTTEAEITVRIANPEEIEITGIEIEDMQIIQVTRNVTQNGITSITVRSTPIRYYDSYKLTGIKYKTLLGEEKTKSVQNEIKVQFYKEIYTFEDWQSIEEGTYQNYKLMADIDFAGKSNIKNNISINRLESDNKISTLKNINLTYNEANAGLIKDVRTNIKNIGFENITLTNTKGTDNYFGIIATNQGNIDNLRFNNITIDAKGMNYVGMIGDMRLTTIADRVTNIELSNITIKGRSYVGGLIGFFNMNLLELDMRNISADNVNIEATGDYAGGIMGYQYGRKIEANNISISNSHIKGGNNYTGGIFGYYFYGNLTGLTVDNTEITGRYYVGGMAGCSRCASGSGEWMLFDIQISNSTINASGNLIGGVSGYIYAGSIRRCSVIDTSINITSSGSRDIGGMIGRYAWGNINYFELINTDINGMGTNVGGAIGYHAEDEMANGTVSYGYIYDCNINGNKNVGGAIGHSSFGYATNVYINANVRANTSDAGGIFGYFNNIRMTASAFTSSIANTLVVDSTVTAPTNAGGLIGDLETEIYRGRSFFYNDYVDADVTSTNTSTGSLIIGGRPDENSYIKNTYVYKYSKLNGNYVYATNDNIEDNQYLVRADLNNQSTFSSKIGLGTTYWNYASLSQGKYPKIKDSYIYHPELQIGVNLPLDPEIASIDLLNEGNTNESGNNGNDDENTNAQNGLTAQNNIVNKNRSETENTETLLSYAVYPVSVNEINVDFSNNSIGFAKDENTVEEKNKTTFTYYINGEEKETVELRDATNQTYTFKYNYKDTIKIKLTRENDLGLNNMAENNQTDTGSDESVIGETNTDVKDKTSTKIKTNINTEVITITPDDVRSEASLVGDNNAYLLGTNLYINGELQQGEYVNLYEGKALRKDGTVINIATGEVVENEWINLSNNGVSLQTYLGQDVVTTLEENAKPLHTYNYKDYSINTYGTYSTVNGNIKTQIYNARSGKLSALSNSLDMKIENSIIDNYNDKEYQTILSTEGELVDLKEMLKYPDNILTRNIKQIAQNTDAEKTEVMVLYNTGKAIVFNYVTGEVVYENNEKADNGLADYLAGSLSNIWNDYEEKQQEYEKSKELEQKLTELPIEEALKSGMDNISNTSSGNRYLSVYNAETKEYEVYSENEILNSNDETPVSETEKITQNGLENVYGYNAKEEVKPQTNGAIIVIAIIVVAVIALVILRKIIVKSNTKKKK